MRHSNLQQPIWAWVVLIGCGLFLLSALPGFLLTLFMTFWQANELSFFSIIFMTITLCILVVTGWGMKRAIQAIRAYNQAKKNLVLEYIEVTDNRKKPIWPWVVIGSGALLLISAGPGVIMLPIAPLFLAGMSTDSGTTPDYVPILILVIGYGLIVGYIILLVKAIKALRAK